MGTHDFGAVHFSAYDIIKTIKNLIIDKITYVDTKIVSITQNENGIDKLIDQDGDSYSGDLFIDCTGFKSLLLEQELKIPFRSFNKWLLNDSAVVLQTQYKNHKEECFPYTKATAMNAGWMFTIPVYDRMGNGYIFDSDYITAEEAKAEVEALLGHEITVGKQINFDPGAVDRPWIGNCCAIGLSASFIEPLEASSIGTSINQSFLLCEKLINYTPSAIKKYNDTMNIIIDNIRDFIALHYMSDRRDTAFWKAVSESEIPDSLADQLGMFQQKLPRPDDFYGTQYMLFNAVHYILVMHGLSLFDINAIREEYFLTVHPDKQQEASHIIQQGRTQPCETIPHKTMLDVIRNLKKENK
jgi:tryptophan halogenase